VSDKTAAQAVYEAYLAAVGDPLLPPWDELTSAEYRGWEAAAQAATDIHLAKYPTP
jgi:hypothetical protein